RTSVKIDTSESTVISDDIPETSDIQTKPEKLSTDNIELDKPVISIKENKKPIKLKKTPTKLVVPDDPQYYNEWLPPTDQKGDGKLDMNEKFGY
ncbi:hypothetical protein A3Q56_01569, partial [Intoshia linei]